MDLKVSSRHQMLLNRFVEICKADEHVAAAFLVGSYAKGEADEYSDLDLYLITNDEAHADFAVGRDDFIRLLGNPLFVEGFDIPNLVFLIFSDDAEVELHYIPMSQVGQIFNAPYQVLLDKENIAANVTLYESEVDPARQTEKLRRLIFWFWHDFSHFVTAMGRDQLWWAIGQLDVLRSICVNLARLQHNFSDPEIGDEPYFKLENVLPIDSLSPLRETFCLMEKDRMRKAGFDLANFYRDLAIPLARSHGITYPERLEQVLLERLAKMKT